MMEEKNRRFSDKYSDSKGESLGRLFLILTVVSLGFVGIVLIIDIYHSKSLWEIIIKSLALCVEVVVFFMVRFLAKLFRTENEKAHEKTREIEAMSRSKSRFFSNMSHEIRTPINTIIGLNEMILREDISPEVEDDARNIKSASGMLLSLINDVLDMSKIESGNMTLVPVTYNTGDMLSEIVGMIWGRANAKGLKFTIDVDPEIPAQLFADEVRIKQILINLLNNAVKYTQQGRVSLAIQSRRLDSGKVLVIYTVEDTGMGIKKESIPYLFDAFRREDEGKNRYIEGTGLGLSIVKQLVDLMGGNITVNSIYTKGSTFIVSIEQEIADENALGDFKISRQQIKNHRDAYKPQFEAPDAHVLIVDDNTANLMVEKKLLRSTRVSVDTAESGKEALELTLINHYDAIFMDHMMPEMDGIEALRLIREQSGGRCVATPVVVLTANVGSENQALYKNAGFDAYLVKPVDGQMLERTLMSVLPKSMVSAESSAYAGGDAEGIVKRGRRRVPLLITTDSVSDLPEEIVDQMEIPILPYKVHTDHGVFYDGIETDGDAITRYMDNDINALAKSESPSVDEYEAFFADRLYEAQHILHITIAKNASEGYKNASEAARSFYNVNVVEAGHLSSGSGLIVMKLKEAVDSGISNPEQLSSIVDRLRKKVVTTFIVDSTEYLHRNGRMSDRAYRLCNAFMVHPMLRLKKSTMDVGAIMVGSYERVADTYIKRILRHPETIDTDVLFITYVGLRLEQAEKIREKALARVPFKKVYLQKASPAIASNSGNGTFGLIFARK